MNTVLTGSEMKDLDAHTITTHHMPSLVLMERAALACVDVLTTEHFDMETVTIICGPGNNGGDGVAIARLLHMKGLSVQVVVVGNSDKRTEETKHQILIAESYHVPITSFSSMDHTRKPTTIIDGLFGIGSVRAPRDEFLDAIRWMNSWGGEGVQVLAIDIPSGVSADTGHTPGEAVHADATVTFAFTKVGLTLSPGSDLAGKVLVKDIGIYKHNS